METKEILKELERDYKPTENKKTNDNAKADKFNAVSIFIFSINNFKVFYEYTHLQFWYY